MGTKPKWTELGDETDARGLRAASKAFAEAMRIGHYSAQTVGTRAKHLRPFLMWCHERGIREPTEVTKQLLERYRAWLFHYQKDDGEPLTVWTQAGMLTSLRRFFSWLAKDNRILFNPASELELPRKGLRIPKQVFTPEEVERVLAQPDVMATLGLRDRAILETFYSTGIRRRELIALELEDLDAARGTLHVRKGKGGRERVVPIGERAIAWIAKYLEEVRVQQLRRRGERAIFVTKDGEPFTPSAMTYVACQYIEAAKLGKRGVTSGLRGCHFAADQRGP